MLEVINPGLLSTIQDGGRPDYAGLGVPQAGACDPWALAVANLLLDNLPGAAALEMTIMGPELRLLNTAVVALAGADLGAHVPEEGRVLRPGGAYLLRAGTTLAFQGPAQGARAYLALAGGIAVPAVLGSAATYLAGGFGGLDGRPLHAGDRLMPARPAERRAAGRLWPEDNPGPLYSAAPLVRVLPGPHLDRLPSATLAALAATTWEVAPESDRMGLRLRGPALSQSQPGRELVSQGVVWGAIQLPPDGRPIVLLADHQTTGGYPVPAVVIRADWPLLAQLAPGARLRFTLTDLPAAQAAYRAQQTALLAAVARLRGTEPWAEF